MGSDILPAATDHELLAGQVVKIIFLFLLLFGVVYNVLRAFRAATWRGRLSRVAFALFLLAIALPVMRWIMIEDSLLRKPRYTIGATTGYCEAFARGKAVAFEYEVKGVVYRNCNAYHPIPVDSIVVPGGRYYVRYSEKYPEWGRMDFYRKKN
jgi:hypothetical protein